MGASMISCELPLDSPREVPLAVVFTGRRRRIDARAGHALEILGHAIEYLTDEFFYEATTLSANNP